MCITNKTGCSFSKQGVLKTPNRSAGLRYVGRLVTLITLLLLLHFSQKLLLRSKPVNWLFWLLTEMCTQGHFWLLFTVILTTLNNTSQCFYQSKTVDSFWPVNVRTTLKIWQCLTFKCNRQTLGSISKFWLNVFKVCFKCTHITVLIWYSLLCLVELVDESISNALNTSKSVPCTTITLLMAPNSLLLLGWGK